MTDTELLRATLDRLGLTYKAAAGIVGMSEVTLKRYCTGHGKIKPQAWRGLLEHEAKIYQRQQALQDQAARITGNTPPEAPRRRGRPRKAIQPEDQ